MEGDGLKTLLQHKEQNYDNYYVLFDNKLDKTKEEISKTYGDVNVCLYNDEDFKENNLNRPISKYHRWGSHQNPNYFYAHHRMMVFYLKNPNFDYYWFFDDDVTFKGDMKEFLKSYQDYTADFLAIQVFKKEDYYNQFPHVSKVNERMGSGGHWLSFAPGPGDNYESFQYHLGSFFPIVRFSAKALSYLTEVNCKGHFGYSEGFVPTTIANVPGFTVASMLNDRDEYFVQTQAECEIFHKGSKFTWTWI